MNQARNLLFAALLLASATAQAGNATWSMNPINGDWNTAANWTPARIPNGPLNTATFTQSNLTDITVSDDTQIKSIIYNAIASSYVVTVNQPHVLTITNGGIINNSLRSQTLIAGPVVDPANFAASIIFEQAAAPGSSLTFIAQGNPAVYFGTGGLVSFRNYANAGQSTLIAQGGPLAGTHGGFIGFDDHASAAQSYITVEGGNVAGASGANVQFADQADAGSAFIILEGATATGATGGAMNLNTGATAASATVIINGGTQGGAGATCSVNSFSDGGTARFEIFGNGSLVLANVAGAVGSLEGDGSVTGTVGAFSVGTNNLSTLFSGTITDGLLEKVGTGTLTLTGANTYAGGTTVIAGTLVIENKTGSGTGSGVVSVTSGTLGGSGIIAGAVTVGTGSGAGAFLAPAHGENKQLTLTIQSSLTFNSDATYTYSFRAKRNKSKIDKVIANGVTINSGATINLSGETQGRLTQGTMLTLIKNTAATPIAGTFSNLPDGGIVNVNGNNLQADYEGGDGNDLTLTVVP